MSAAAIAVVLLSAVAATSASASSGGTVTAFTGRVTYGFSWPGGLAPSPFLASPFLNLSARATAEGAGDASIARERKPKPKPTLASALILPSAGQCVSGRTLTIRLRRRRHVRWVVEKVHVNGRLFETIRRAELTRPVELRGLPRGTFVLSITARTRDGRSVTATRTYRTCVTKTPPPSDLLSVALAGSGSGTVTGSGISCPGSCSDSYPAGTMVTLTAASGSGSSFTGWSGGGCSGTGTCTVTMSSDQSVTATFATNPPPSYTLTVGLAGAGSGSVKGSGISCPGSCSDSYPAGTMVTLTAASGSGSSFTGWSGGGCSGTGTCTVTMSSDQSVTATFTTAPTPGSYTISYTSQNVSDGSFYVSADGTELQDVTVPTSLACTPTYNSGIADHVQFASIAIGSDGSFNSGTVTETGVIANSPATFTYTLSGRFMRTQVTGSLQEDITFNNGTAYSCTTNPQTWSATRDTQGTQTTSPPPGSYTVSSTTHQNVSPGSLYVSADGTELQDVTVPTLLACTPTYNSGGDHVQFASIAIGSDGSFNSGTVTETGVIDSEPATFTYTFSGNFHGTTTAGAERAAGQLRENITFNNGNQISCTTNPQTWSATRDTQGTQTTSPPPGSYTVSSTTHQNVSPGSLYVSADGTQLQDVTVPTLLACTPTYNSGGDHVQFASIAIGRDGSFNSGTVTETGVIDSEPATFTYTFSGNFHGTTTAGAERAAGQLRENITFNNGNQISCTTNPQTWSATRDTQGTQTTSPPPGSYTVSSTTHQNVSPGSFTVSADGTQLQDVTVPTLLACTPTYNSGGDHVQFASIAIGSDGSFNSGTVTETGTFDNEPATFTYTFSGNFHGTNSSGDERAAGELRENITFNNGNQILVHDQSPDVARHGSVGLRV